MSKRTDEELIKIVTIDRDGYQPLAITAAEEEIKCRKLDTVKIEQVESELKAEIEEKKQIDDKTVSSLIRFVHFIIDTIAWFVLAFILASILDILFNISEEFVMLIGYLTLFVTFIGYYYMMEVSFQKTVAKFITKTKVVTNDGNKPSKKDILVRTFCRFVPLDHVSYLFTRNGFHDRLSNTKILKDDRIET
jgi:uncharacterized RDD family membrane protein YckC